MPLEDEIGAGTHVYRVTFFLLALVEVVGGKDFGAGRKSIEVAGFRT
jgi:hypothetical protein